jgi:hypothetical protein
VTASIFLKSESYSRAGADFLNSVPGPPKSASEQFALRREAVESIVDRVEVDAAKNADVTFIFDFSEISPNDPCRRAFVIDSDFGLWLPP